MMDIIVLRDLISVFHVKDSAKLVSIAMHVSRAQKMTIES
jgi:hypothetical protein